MRYFRSARLDYPPREKLETRRANPSAIGPVAGCPGRGVAASTQKLFDATIFERVERDDGEATTGREQLLGRNKAAIEFAELVIYRDSQRLERPRRWILPRLGSRYGGSHDRREFARTPNALALPLGCDRAGDAGSEALFA